MSSATAAYIEALVAEEGLHSSQPFCIYDSWHLQNPPPPPKKKKILLRLNSFDAYCKPVVKTPTNAAWYIQGSHLHEKTAFFMQNKSRLRKSENAVRILYAKKWPHTSKWV